MSKEKILQNYTVKTEELIPATVTYIIQAYSPEEAGDPKSLKTKAPHRIQYRVPLGKIRKVTVYEIGMSIIKYIKNIF